MKPLPQIAFIIVTYNEFFYECATYKTLLTSIKESTFENYKIFIYDNSDKEGWSIDSFSEKQNDKVYYYHDATNAGISIAYNRMAEKARTWGAEWLVLLDQDTFLPNNAVKEYLQSALNKNGILVKVPIQTVNNWILSPFRQIMMRGYKLKHVEYKPYRLKEYSFINSGTMVALTLFQKVGGYNEKVKIDFSDFQFIDRIKNHVEEFEVLPIFCKQTFSNEDGDISRALKRFDLFLKDLRNCDKNGLFSVISYKIVGFLHAIKLTGKFKSIKFIVKYIRS